MNILYIITGLGMGGAETQLSAVAQRMAKNNNVCVCYLTGDQMVMLDASDIRIVRLDIKKTISGFIKGYKSLRRLIAEFKPDIVHSHMVHANIIARLVRLTISIPRLVCTAHNTYEGGKLRMLAYRITDGLADVSTNVSQEAVLSFEEKGAVPKGKMKVVFNGIDMSVFNIDITKRSELRTLMDVSDEEKIILSVGRLVEAKDYPTLINTFNLLREHDRSIKLWIVGEGDEKASLVKLVETLGLKDCVHFWGVRTDIAALYNAADVYVLSSAWEGFGLVVAEAMATERVVVATDCGGVREVLGDHGFLVPIKDVPALAVHISQALSLSPEAKKIMGKQARARILENFSLDNTVSNWLKIYKK